MALRFFDGFDHWSQAQFLNKWTSQSSVTSNTGTVGRFGSGTGQCFTLAAGYARKTLDAQGTWILGCAIKIFDYNHVGDLLGVLSGGSLVGSVSIQATGKLAIITFTSSGAIALNFSAKPLPALGVWYYIEFKYVGATLAGNVVSQIRVNGEVYCDFTGGQSGTFGQTNVSTTCNVVSIINPFTAFNYDDFYACDGTGSINNNFLGDVRVDTLSPTGAGNYTDWTPSAGSNWDAVDEQNPNSDTDYVSSNTANNIDSYVTSNLLSTPVNIYGIQQSVWARYDDGGPHTLKHLVRLSSTDYLGATQTLTGSYTFYFNVMETSPATSTVWTASEINGIETGFKLIT